MGVNQSNRIVDDRNGVDFQETLRPGQRGHSHQRVSRLMVAEQRSSPLLDLREVLTLIVGDEDRQFRHLAGSSASCAERLSDVREHLVSLSRHVAVADDAALFILGYLTCDKNHSSAGGDDNVAVCQRCIYILRIYGFQRHWSTLSLLSRICVGRGLQVMA
jgi:hypothetical protein